MNVAKNIYCRRFHILNTADLERRPSFATLHLGLQPGMSFTILSIELIDSSFVGAMSLS